MRDERSIEILLSRPLATYPPNACDLVSGWTGLFRSHRSTAAVNFMKFMDCSDLPSTLSGQQSSISHQPDGRFQTVGHLGCLGKSLQRTCGRRIHPSLPTHPVSGQTEITLPLSGWAKGAWKVTAVSIVRKLTSKRMSQKIMNIIYHKFLAIIFL